MIKQSGQEELTLCEHLEEHNCQCYVHYQDQQYELLAWKPVLDGGEEKRKLINLCLDGMNRHSWRSFSATLKADSTSSNWDGFLLNYESFANIYSSLACMHKFPCNLRWFFLEIRCFMHGYDLHKRFFFSVLVKSSRLE